MPIVQDGKEWVWTESQHCLSHVHCAICQGFAVGTESIRDTWAQWWAPPKNWVCPFGRTRPQIEAADLARAQQQEVTRIATKSTDWSQTLAVLPVKLTVEDKVDMIGALVDIGKMDLAVAEATATKLGIDLSTEVGG